MTDATRWKCPQCGRAYKLKPGASPPSVCPACEQDDAPVAENGALPPRTPLLSTEPAPTQRKLTLSVASSGYPFLAAIMLLYYIGAAVVFAAVVVTVFSSEIGGSSANLWSLGIGTLSAISLAAFGQLIQLFMDVAQHTREQKEISREILDCMTDQSGS